MGGGRISGFATSRDPKARFTASLCKTFRTSAPNPQKYEAHVKTKLEIEREKDLPFSAFVRRVIETNATQQKAGIEDQHWRSYEHICPCEVDYDFIGHFENVDKEAPTLLKIIGVDGYVKFPDYRPSKTSPYMLEYYSQLTIDEIFQLQELFDLDFKLFGYDFPGLLEDILKEKGPSEES